MRPMERLARRVTKIEHELRRRKTTPSLANSSIENGAITVNALDGTTTGSFGTQFDGTTAPVTYVSPLPPTPYRPSVRSMQGGVVISWDGTFSDVAGEQVITTIAPMDFKQVDVAVSPNGSTAPTIGTVPIASFISPRGGGVFYATDDVVQVALVTRTLAGTPSALSVAVAGEPLPSIVTPSGNEIFFATSSPLGLGPDDANDLWYDTDNDNATYRWDGTTWVPFQLGEDAIADNAIVTAKLAAGAVTANEIQAGSIGAQELAAEMVLATRIVVADEAGGRRVELSPQSGVALVAEDGEPLVTLPTDPDQVATFRGASELTSLRVTEGLSVDADGEISKDGSLRLSAGTTAPVSAPTIRHVWDTVKLDTKTAASPLNPARGDLGTFALDPAQITAFGAEGTLGGWVVAQKVANGTRIWRFTPTGQIRLNGSDPWVEDLVGWKTISGVFVRPGATALSYVGTNPAGQWGFVGSRAVTGATWENRITPAYTSEPALGWDAVNSFYLLGEVDANDQVVIRRLQITEINGRAPLEAATAIRPVGESGPGRNGSLASISRGNFDYGGARFVYTAKGMTNVWVTPTNTATPALLTNEAFSTPPYSRLGTVWDGANFWTLGSDGELSKHTEWTWTDANNKIYARISFRDSDPVGGPHETDPGPFTGLTRRKRAKVAITVPPVPDNGGVDDPDQWALYVALGSEPPTTLSEWRLQAVGAGASSTARSTHVLTSYNAAGAVPPAVNNFPDSGGALLYSGALGTDGLPLWEIRGNGTFRTPGREQRGRVDVATTAGAIAGVNVTFPRAYPPGTIPVVNPVLEITTPNNSRQVTVTAITNTGFTLRVLFDTTTTVSVGWSAARIG